MEEDAGRPEELLNSYVKLRMAAGKIASGLGILALLWSTVVLLGGFVSDLPMMQFWIITLISLMMACNMVDISENEITKGIYLEEAKIIPMLRRQKWIEAGYMKGFLKTMAGIMFVPKVIIFFCLGLVFQYSSSLSFVLSLGFLVRGETYDDAGVDIDKRGKLRAALSIFYCLVLLQSLAVIYWMCLVLTVGWSIEQVASATNKQCGFEGWGSKVVRMYALETIRKFRKDWGLPDNWNLITYAVGLLQSASAGDDHLWGARVLDTFFGKDDLSVGQELLSSKRSVQNLIAMIVDRGGTADSIESRERAARIVAQHLASHLHVTHFPGTLECICSLLDPQDVTCPSEKPEERLPVPDEDDDSNRPLETVVPIRDHKINASEQVITSSSVGLVANTTRISLRGWIKKYYEGVRQQRKAAREKRRFLDPKYRHPYESKGVKELISQGLLILERLTEDKVNCTEISKHQALLCMITSPLSSSHDFISNGQDDTMVNMLIKSLTVVSRLLTSRGDGATWLRQELASNTEVVSNLMSILESDSEGAQQLHEQALEILTELAFDDSFTKPGSGESASACMLNKLFETLRSIFLEEKEGMAEADREKVIRLRGKAGEALARLLAVHAARGLNVADILSKQEAIKLLTKVLDEIKSSKMGTSAGAATRAGASNSDGAADNVAGSQTPEEADSEQPRTQRNEKQSDKRRFVAAMLSLAMAIRNSNVMSKEDFAGAIHEDAELVEKLAEILKVNKHSKAECLRAVKLTCQVVIAMTQDEPSCIQRFNGHSFKESLTEVSKNMAEVDGCVLFAGNDREVIKPARSLASLVREAQGHLGTAQEQGN